MRVGGNSNASAVHHTAGVAFSHEEPRKNKRTRSSRRPRGIKRPTAERDLRKYLMWQRLIECLLYLRVVKQPWLDRGLTNGRTK